MANKSPFPYIAVYLDKTKEKQLYLTEKAIIRDKAELKLGDRGIVSVSSLEQLYGRLFVDGHQSYIDGRYFLFLHPHVGIQFKLELKQFYRPADQKALTTIRTIFNTAGIDPQPLEDFYLGDYCGFHIFCAKHLAFDVGGFTPIVQETTVSGQKVEMLSNIVLNNDQFFWAISTALHEKSRSNLYDQLNDPFIFLDCDRKLKSSEIYYTKIFSAKEEF